MINSLYFQENGIIEIRKMCASMTIFMIIPMILQALYFISLWIMWVIGFPIIGIIKYFMMKLGKTSPLLDGH